MIPLLLMQAAPDVVVTAERLHKLRLATSVEGGRLTGCVVRVSSGDALIDRSACQAMHACIDTGVTASEPLANCIDARIVATVRGAAPSPSDNK